MMNIEELLISGESQTIEFKESFDRESIETVVAFANNTLKGGKGVIKGPQRGQRYFFRLYSAKNYWIRNKNDRIFWIYRT